MTYCNTVCAYLQTGTLLTSVYDSFFCFFSFLFFFISAYAFVVFTDKETSSSSVQPLVLLLEQFSLCHTNINNPTSTWLLQSRFSRHQNMLLVTRKSDAKQYSALLKSVAVHVASLA